MNGINLNNNNPYTSFDKLNFPKPKECRALAYQKNNNEKSEKRKKIAKISLASSTILIGAALCANILKHKSYKGLLEAVKKKKETLTEMKLGNKLDKVSSNIINIKDDLWDKFITHKKVKKSPLFFLDKIAVWITGVYNKGLRTSLGPKYNNAVKKLEKLGYFNKNNKVAAFDEWFNKTNDSMYDILHKKGERVTDDLFNRDIFKKVTNSNIADDKLSTLLEKEYLQIPENASKEMKEAIEEFNKIKGLLLPKMRDINCGSAPTDLLTIVVSTLGLGAAAINADSKEERKGILVNLGIPLLTTLASTTYGTIKAFSGVKSLMFGFASGQAAAILAKIIDKNFLEKNPKNKKEKDAQ